MYKMLQNPDEIVINPEKKRGGESNRGRKY